jgi:hypothetical protein
VRIIIASCCALLLTACTETTKVLDKPVLVDRAELIVPPVQSIVQSDMKWIVITPENYAAKAEELSTKGNVVLFALTPQGYQNLSMNVAELRKYIQQQNAVIAAYQEYYKNEQKPAPESK